MGSTGPSHDVDVIIIGAGLSGLTAALTLHNAGLSYIILEARSRIGGKTLSTPRPDGKGKQELGAAWINDSNQSEMWKLAQRLGMAEGGEMVEQNVRGDVAVQDFRNRILRFPYGSIPEYERTEDTEDCLRVRDMVSNSKDDKAMLQIGSERRKELDGMSFEEWLWAEGVGMKGRATAKVWTHAMLGVDPGEVSALYFLEYCRCGGGLMTMRGDGKHGGQYLRLKGGTSGFAEGLIRELREAAVATGKAVVGVKQGSEGVTVRTKGGEEFTGKKVIVSVPTPVYKHIDWEPLLPAQKAGAANATRYGCYTKYIVLFKTQFWRDRGFCGLSQSFLGPVSVTRDTSVDDEENFAMTCFIGGVFGRKWSALPAEEKKVSVLKQLGEIFMEGNDIGELCLDAMESPWIDEEWSGWGCPCPVMPPGVMEEGKAIEALRKPFENAYFVGTEMADVWRGYMEGAVRTGDAGAKEVIAALKN